MPDVLAPVVTRIFEPMSVVTTPFFAGFPGFRPKFRLFDHDTGDYEGIYRWESADAAERYTRDRRQVMPLFSRQWSISYEILSETPLDDHLAGRAPEARPADP